MQTLYRSLVWNQTRHAQPTYWDAAADLCIDPYLEHGWCKFNVWNPSLISFPLSLSAYRDHSSLCPHWHSVFYDLCRSIWLYLIIQGCQNFFCPKAESGDLRCKCYEVHRTDLLCKVSICPLSSEFQKKIINNWGAYKCKYFHLTTLNSIVFFIY